MFDCLKEMVAGDEIKALKSQITILEERLSRAHRDVEHAYELTDKEAADNENLVDVAKRWERFKQEVRTIQHTWRGAVITARLPICTIAVEDLNDLDAMIDFLIETDSVAESEQAEQEYDETIEDGFGSEWSKRCPECDRLSMHVVRPGKAQCAYCG